MPLWKAAALRMQRTSTCSLDIFHIQIPFVSAKHLDLHHSVDTFIISCHARMQALYSYTSGAATAHLPGDKFTAATASGVLTELHVEGFDAEQIWLQLDMASAQLVRRAKRLLKKAGTDPSLLTPETEEDLTGEMSVESCLQLSQQPMHNPT